MRSILLLNTWNIWPFTKHKDRINKWEEFYFWIPEIFGHPANRSIFISGHMEMSISTASSVSFLQPLTSISCWKYFNKFKTATIQSFVSWESSRRLSFSSLNPMHWHSGNLGNEYGFIYWSGVCVKFSLGLIPKEYLHGNCVAEVPLASTSLEICGL